MTTGKRAMHEVALAIARAAATTTPKFADALGTELRQRLARMSAREKTFDEALQWLEQFEAGEPEAPSRQPATTDCGKIGQDISDTASST